MNFYTLIFNYVKPKQWLTYCISGFTLSIVTLFVFNYIVDPYNMTKYNLFNIKQKFARDDRLEKVNYFAALPKFDNILIGSSRVYTIDPKYVSQKLGGTTYNFGVGTANVEDHLGILLYLKKLNKLPKNLIIGIDFYTFNPDIPPNKYFLKNRDLNFLSFNTNTENQYWSKFLTFDSLRASWKTLKNHLKNSQEKSFFDELGWSPRFFDEKTRDFELEKILVLKEINDNVNLYSNFQYSKVDQKRLEYYEQIRTICEENNINLYIFLTPLHPVLLEKLFENNTSKAIIELNDYFSTFKNFHNFFFDDSFNTNWYNFYGATHTNSKAGYGIIDRILRDK